MADIDEKVREYNEILDRAKQEIDNSQHLMAHFRILDCLSNELSAEMAADDYSGASLGKLNEVTLPCEKATDVDTMITELIDGIDYEYEAERIKQDTDTLSNCAKELKEQLMVNSLYIQSATNSMAGTHSRKQEVEEYVNKLIELF